MSNVKKFALRCVQSLVVVLVVSFSLLPLLVSHAEAADNSWTTKASRTSSLLSCREKREAEGS